MEWWILYFRDHFNVVSQSQSFENVTESTRSLFWPFRGRSKDHCNVLLFNNFFMSKCFRRGSWNLTYKWSLGDGSDDINTSVPYITHAYSSHGQYNISVIATNGIDRKTNVSVVTVEDPITVILVQSSTATLGQSSEFSITVTNGSDFSCNLDFDLGSDLEVTLPQE